MSEFFVNFKALSSYYLFLSMFQEWKFLSDFIIIWLVVDFESSKHSKKGEGNFWNVTF